MYIMVCDRVEIRTLWKLLKPFSLIVKDAIFLFQFTSYFVALTSTVPKVMNETFHFIVAPIGCSFVWPFFFK